MNESAFIRLPVGVRDFLPRAAGRRRQIAEALLDELERWGYERIITPAFEYADVLARGLGDDARAAAIRFVEPATGEIVALRPDITPQVARMVATRLGDVRGPIRLCYEGSVMRLNPGARGQRELIQTGVELIDAPSPDGDAEVIALCAASLAAAGLPEVTIDVGHVALAKAALEAVDDPAKRAEIRERMARKDTAGVARLAGEARVTPKRRRLIEALPSLSGEAGPVLARARALPLSAEEQRALDELEHALELVADHGTTARMIVDLGEARGFEYYTGIRFAAYLPGCGDAAARGGRYDHLIGRYGRAARATGFAVDVEAVAVAEDARGAPGDEPAAAALIVDKGDKGDKGGRGQAVPIAAALRKAGVRAAVDLGAHDGDAALLAYAAGRKVVVLDGKRARLLSPSRAITAAALAAAARGEGAALAAELGLSASRRNTSWP